VGRQAFGANRDGGSRGGAHRHLRPPSSRRPLVNLRRRHALLTATCGGERKDGVLGGLRSKFFDRRILSSREVRSSRRSDVDVILEHWGRLLRPELSQHVDPRDPTARQSDTPSRTRVEHPGHRAVRSDQPLVRAVLDEGHRRRPQNRPPCEPNGVGSPYVVLLRRTPRGWGPTTSSLGSPHSLTTSRAWCWSSLCPRPANTLGTSSYRWDHDGTDWHFRTQVEINAAFRSRPSD
jgi:hypothetical protein